MSTRPVPVETVEDLRGERDRLRGQVEHLSRWLAALAAGHVRPGSDGGRVLRVPKTLIRDVPTEFRLVAGECGDLATLTYRPASHRGPEPWAGGGTAGE